MNQAPIKPPQFDDITANIFGPAPKPQDYAPRTEPAPAWPSPQVDTIAPRIEALTREIVINRELIRRHGNLSKGQIHEQIETIKEELFTPRQASDTQAILQAVQGMLREHMNEVETLLTAHSIRSRQIPPEQPRQPEQTPEPAMEAAAPEPVYQEPEEQLQEEEPTTAFYGRLDVPDTPTIQPAMSAAEMGEPMRPRKKAVPTKA